MKLLSLDPKDRPTAPQALENIEKIAFPIFYRTKFNKIEKIDITALSYRKASPSMRKRTSKRRKINQSSHLPLLF
jgi:hypothetical protein